MVFTVRMLLTYFSSVFPYGSVLLDDTIKEITTHLKGSLKSFLKGGDVIVLT